MIHEKCEQEERWASERGALYPSILLASRKQWESVPNNPFPWPFGEIEEVRLRRAKEIETILAGDEDSDLKQKCRAKLAAIKREYRAIFRPIEARVTAGHDGEAEARWQLATTVPTTVAGVMALLAHVQQEEEKCAGDFFQDDERDEFFSSLGQAAIALEGRGATAPASVTG